MTGPDHAYDDVLRRALHSTLDPIEPADDDGLAKIQQRIAEPWLKRQVWLLRAGASALGWLIFVRCEPFVNWARSGLTAAAARVSSRSGRPGDRRGRGRSAGGLGWLGPTSWHKDRHIIGGFFASPPAGRASSRTGTDTRPGWAGSGSAGE